MLTNSFRNDAKKIAVIVASGVGILTWSVPALIGTGLLCYGALYMFAFVCDKLLEINE